jgi:hypothetical protein
VPASDDRDGPFRACARIQLPLACTEHSAARSIWLDGAGDPESGVVKTPMKTRNPARSCQRRSGRGLGSAGRGEIRLEQKRLAGWDRRSRTRGVKVGHTPKHKPTCRIRPGACQRRPPVGAWPSSLRGPSVRVIPLTCAAPLVSGEYNHRGARPRPKPAHTDPDRTIRPCRHAPRSCRRLVFRLGPLGVELDA